MITQKYRESITPTPPSVCPVCDLCGSVDAIFHPDDPGNPERDI
jgi:hypothetical protein